MFSFLKKPWGIVGLAVLLLLPLLFLCDIPQRDVLSRYAPMAQAIAAGDWPEAFHPRSPFLFPALGAACIWLFHCGAFTGVKIASALCFLLTVFPLWKIFSSVFDRTTARIGCVLFVFCPYWLRLASSGLRAGAKLLFLIWAVWGLLELYRNRKSVRGYLVAGAACGAMAAVRDDSLLIGAVLGLACIWLEVAGTRRFPWRSLIAGAIGAMILAPGLFLNYRMTGYPVPCSRLVGMAASVMGPDAFGSAPSSCPIPRLLPGGSAFPEGNLLSAPAAAVPARVVPVRGKTAFQPVSWSIFADFVDSVAKGYFFWFAIPAVVMIVLRIRSREWTGSETLLLAVWAGHGLLLILEILIFDRYLYVSRRYLLPAAPLAFGWTALAIRELYGFCARRFSAAGVRKIATGIAILAGAALYLEAIAPELKARFYPDEMERRDAMLVWSAKIRALYPGPSHQAAPLRRTESYHTFRRPLVVCEALPQLGYLAGGEGCELTPEEALALGLRADFLSVRVENGKAPAYSGYRLLEVRRGSRHSYALYICGRR